MPESSRNRGRRHSLCTPSTSGSRRRRRGSAHLRRRPTRCARSASSCDTSSRSHTRARDSHHGVSTRACALYEQGDVEPLEIVFGATSLDEALSELDTLSRASSQGEDVLLQLRAARIRLHDASRSLSARTAALATALGEARATARSLEAARATRSAYIDSLTAERRLTEQQLSALEAEVQCRRRPYRVARRAAGVAERVLAAALLRAACRRGRTSRSPCR